MNIKELNKSKKPIVIIDNSLEKYIKLPIFQDKLDKANEILKVAGLPKFKKSKLTA
jgi:hypothetical protein